MPPHVFREFSGPKLRERWPVEFDLEGVDRDNRVREQKLQEEPMTAPLSANSFVGGASIDLGKPPRVAYDPRQHEYPKMLYHPTKKDPNWLAEHKRITLYNSLHPEKPEILPVVPAVPGGERQGNGTKETGRRLAVEGTGRVRASRSERGRRRSAVLSWMRSKTASWFL